MNKAFRFTAIAIVTLTWSFVAGLASAQESITVASYGGQYMDMQRKGLFEPFTKATGIKVVEVAGVSVAKVKSMVMTKNVEWDVFISSAADYAQLIADNLIDDIDYSKIDKSILDQLVKGSVQPKVIGAQRTAQVIAWNTKAFPGANHPNSWADVWDTKKFPGPRILPAGNYAINPIEPALLSTGEGRDKVYPLNLDKAYAQLTKIRPSVIRWTNTPSGVPQALVDGEAMVGYANSTRIQELKDSGAPVDYTWNEGIIYTTYWALPKGSKNRAGALKFLDFVSRPEQQAAMAKFNISPVNQKAFDLLTPAERKNLPSAHENFSKLLELQPAAWMVPGSSAKTLYEDNIARWISWSTRK